ncbi:MAG: PP2C family protein-serine/threonine phosphatase, partial [Candidatus Margulisiibacteriota bacterium]
VNVDGLRYAFVTDAAGKVLVSAIPTQNQVVFDKAIDAGKFKTTRRIQIIHVAGLGTFLNVSKPILNQSPVIVHVGMDHDLILTHIYHAIMIQQLVIIILFILSVIFAYIGIRRISIPLINLTHYTTLLSQHTFLRPHDSQYIVKNLAQKSFDEIGTLATAFIQMETMIMQYVQNLKETTAAKERIESELKIAHNIQQGLLPQHFDIGSDTKTTIHAFLEPAKAVGGDLYDFFRKKDWLCFTVGDVSGKGVPAALFMAVAKTYIRSIGSDTDDPGETLTRVNQKLTEDQDPSVFVTVFYGALNLKTGELRYAIAGHNPPYVVRTSGELLALSDGAELVLGIDQAARYTTHTVQLGSGDHIFVYSDGVTEAINIAHEQFGTSRLETILQAQVGSSAEGVITEVQHAVQAFCGDTHLSDDETMLDIKFAL